MKSLLFRGVATVVALTSLGILAQPVARAEEPVVDALVKFKETKLKNGLRVFLVEDHSAPVVSLALIYDVG